MTEHWSRVVVAMLFCLLAFAASARAECAWVLWSIYAVLTNGGPCRDDGWSPMSAYRSDLDCTAKLDSLQTSGDHPGAPRDHRWAPTTLDRYMGDPKKEVTHAKWQCLPDTVDPCGPKAK